MTAAQIRPKDHVIIGQGSTVYTVQAVSRAGQDVYVTDGDNTSIGTWVDVQTVTRVPADIEADGTVTR